MSSEIQKRRRWRESKISLFEDRIVEMHMKGDSLRGIQQMLASHGVIVSHSTVFRFIGSLSEVRIYGGTAQRSS